jgi:hypothetical protein
MPSWEEDLQSLHKCKTHLQNHWSPLFVVFCKLPNAKLIWRGPWRCSNIINYTCEKHMVPSEQGIGYFADICYKKWMERINED